MSWLSGERFVPRSASSHSSRSRVTAVTSATSVRPVASSSFDWGADDGPAADLRRVLDAAAERDGRTALNEAALLALRHRGIGGSTLLSSGSPASGFAWVHGQSSEVDLVVDPAERGHGIGAALLGAVVDAFPSRRLSAWSHGNHPAAAALAPRFGFERVRDLWVMRRLLDVPLPEAEAATVTVDGNAERIDVRPFEAGRDEDAFLAVNAAAFADHPEQGSLDRAALGERTSEAWFDPAGFFLAFAGDELVGYHWTKVHPDGVGEVYVVGVAPTAQGSGLGTLLTLVGLHHLADRGIGEVILYVEADNAAAVAVYSGLGFTHADEDTDVMYVRRPGGR
jgi:mycothiol synthase